MTPEPAEGGRGRASRRRGVTRLYISTEAGDGESDARWRVRIDRVMRPMILGLAPWGPGIGGRRPGNPIAAESNNKRKGRE